MDEENISSSWTQLIKTHQGNPIFRSRTCHIYNHHSRQPFNNPKQRCVCGRLIGRHSLVGASLESESLDKNETWIPPKEFYDNGTHSCSISVNIFGTLKPRDCKFLRVDSRFNTINLNELYHLYHLILEDFGGKKPGLILSVSGGAKYFTLTDQLQTDVVREIIEIAAKADAWILTGGIDTGMSKFIGEGISHYHLLHEYSSKIKCIGLTMWGTISENERLNLKKATKGYPKELLRRQIPSEHEEDDESTVELNHSHCVLFDSGRLNERLSDSHRDKFIVAACHDIGPTCYAVTIMFGGDLNDLELLENDIKNKRPIVLIQGSGRLTDMLATLCDLTSNDAWNMHWNPTDRELATAFDVYFPSYTDQEATAPLKQIKSILDKKNRYLLNVCCFDRDSNVVKTIFNAILSAKQIGKKPENNIDLPNDSLEVIRCLHENRLLDLAFDWNYIDGATPILQRWQDETTNKKLHLIEMHAKHETELFKKCLENNRPTFIDFFLSAGFDPRALTKTKHDWECEQIVWELYTQSRQLMSKSHGNRIAALFGRSSPNSKEQLLQKLHKLVGPFVGSLDTRFYQSIEERICIDFCKCKGSYHRCKQYPIDQLDQSTATLNEDNANSPRNIRKEYSKDQMLRDLFLWAVFMNMPEMAKVLLVHVQSRLCAALIASSIFKQYAKLADTIDLKEILRSQALDFETFAGNFIDRCYEYNEKTACELLFRQLPLFGYVTCMQVAISSKSEKLLQTACFDQALNLVWCSRLALSNSHFTAFPSLLFSAAFFGIPAPVAMKYRKEEKQSRTKKNVNFDLSSQGIDCYVNEKSSVKWSCVKYWLRFRYFHESPMVKMCYHFVSYIWFLLVFSYMMLYQFDNSMTTETHWTEIYVIITVTTMLCEEVRETCHEYNTQMLELSVLPRSTVQAWIGKTFTSLPYLLFYLALSLRFCSRDDDHILTTARIILALDLEIWFLQSFKFVIALKFLGPKLLMLKNMLRDLLAFVYMIFVAIAAYGVVSRSLIFYKQVPFTPHGIFKHIFYDSYWFIYTDVTDKDELDTRLLNTTSNVMAEAMATEILLTFHMLFINILLLNLLIAVFADSIGKVQNNTEFYWRYQRYSFVREYFQRPILAYPPLIIFPHIILLSCAIKQRIFSNFGQNQSDDDDYVSISKRWAPIFKMIPKKDGLRNEHWDLFENAATYSYARSVLKQNKKRNGFTKDVISHRKTTTTTTTSSSDLHTSKDGNGNLTSLVDEQQTTVNIKEELSTLKSAFTGIQQDLQKVIASQQLVTEVISRFKLNEPQQLSLAQELLSSNINAMPEADTSQES